VLDAQEIHDAVDAFLTTSADGRVLALSAQGMSIVTSSAREWEVRTGLSALPFADQSFSRLLCVDTLRHAGDPEILLMEARRVLAAGGGLLSIAVEPTARTTRGLLVKSGFAWSESYDVLTVERMTEASDTIEIRVFATTGWTSES
jgi:ubiquinone/menaquinone biosynthesis C-methylase UbiE